MKIRTDFVTNSSSSSFVTYNIKYGELFDYVKELLEAGKVNRSLHRPNSHSVWGYEACEELELDHKLTITLQIGMMRSSPYNLRVYSAEETGNYSTASLQADCIKMLDIAVVMGAIETFFELSASDKAELKALVKKSIAADDVSCAVFVDETDGFAGYYGHMYSLGDFKHNPKAPIKNSAPTGRAHTKPIVSCGTAGKQSEQYAREISPAPTMLLFQGKNFVHTTCSNESALDEFITSKGGVVRSSTVLATDYLVIGNNLEHKTTKITRALELKAKGKTIIAMTEAEFWRLAEKVGTAVTKAYEEAEHERQAKLEETQEDAERYAKKNNIAFQSLNNFEIDSSHEVKVSKSKILECKKAHDELRKELLNALEDSGEYSYPESDDFYVSGIFTENLNFDVFGELCKYVARESDSDYDGIWSASQLRTFFESELSRYSSGKKYSYSFSFGGLSPVLTILSFLSAYSDIQSLNVTFTHDKWEARGDYTSSERVGIKVNKGKFIVDTVSVDDDFEDDEDDEDSADAWVRKYGKYIISNPTIDFVGKLFAFTGLGWGHDTEKEHPIVQKVISHGGQYRSKVSGLVNYLVVNPSYAGVSKINEAIKYLNNGKKIAVVLLEDLERALEAPIDTERIAQEVAIQRAEEEAKRIAREQEIAAREKKQKVREDARAIALQQAAQKAREKEEAQAELDRRCERFVNEIKRQYNVSNVLITQKELFEKAQVVEISEFALTRYIESKYNQSPKEFFGNLGIIKTQQILQREFNEVLELLKERYKKRSKLTEVTQLISDNADLDLSIIANNAKKFTNMTARELLLSEGILAVEETPSQTDLFVGVLHMPGNEPENIKRRLTTLFAKLDGAYPNKVIEGLNREHKKWGETVTELYRLLGYANSKNFLMAYGYTMADNKGGRTANKNEEIIAELKRRYPNGAPFTSVAQLKEANVDLAPKIKSLENAAQGLYGMSLKNYLVSQNVLFSDKKNTVNISVSDSNPILIEEPSIETVLTKTENIVSVETFESTELISLQQPQTSLADRTPVSADFVIYRGILKQYTGKDSEVVIPETVTKIGERAFKDNKKLKAVTLHDGIVRIDGGAFWGCTSLQSIVIPDSVAKIDWGTFNECSALKEVTIGKGVTNISERAFRNCKALKNLFVSDTVTYFGVSAFDGCGSLTISGYADSAAEKYANKNGIKFKRVVVDDKPVPQAEVTVSNAEINREEELRRIREDNERRVREDQERQARIEAEERKKREEEEALRKAREAEQGIALEEAYRKAQEDAARRAALVAERQAREEEERKKREEIERICREAEERRLREEAERKAKEEAERERKLREEEERKAREEAARKEELRKIQEENERRIREDQERIAREQEAIKKREEEARRAREEAERKAREEAERLEKLKAERRAQKVCQHCGGKFKGLFTKTCSSCGKKKDY